MTRTERNEVLHIEVFGTPNSKTYTIQIQRFFHRIPRVNLSIIEGYHTIEPNPYTNKTIDDTPQDQIVFSMTCRPRDLKELGKHIIQICEPEE